MMSWKEEEELLNKRNNMGRAGSTRSGGGSFEAQRVGSYGRKSVELPASPGGSVPKGGSLLRQPGKAAEGSLGSEGWWHHMDHAAANEVPDEGKATAAKTSGYAAQFGVTGQSKSLWADEDAAPASPSAAATVAAPTSPPAPAATPAPVAGSIAAAAAAPASPATAAPVPIPAAPVAPASPAATAAAASPAAAAAAVSSPSAHGVDGTIKDAHTTGWWRAMDNGILNQPAEAAEAGAVKKGERVMGGAFVPQFGVAGGNRYGSIFDQQPESAPVESHLAALSLGAAAPAPAAPAAAAVEDDWSGFASASPAPAQRV